ncbi:hypothetical protein V6N13_065073 [Hibiscus sabdariffa]
MYYHRALKLLAFLDSSSEADTTVTEEEGIALMKYTYVVSCQKYWEHKAKRDPRAEEIMDLLKHNEALRVSYIDQVSTGIDEKEYYSVLLKYDRQLQREVEIYRIKLPGPIKLGEGKPENQNHGFVYTRGDAVQTIDMNQDNYFEEALKIRNLLEEFRHNHGIRRPTILGVREHIFTGSVSSVAWFMSAQETSFVTLLQRLFANPLKIRMHYGHPDVFDRLWFMTRGGLSKASKVINISEDIFAGFNCTLRGGNVTHHEYIQVGKGRDLGLNQISTFETKIACGNGEQFLSRDVYRLSHRLDFFRMLSFFYTTIGYFFNTTVIILSLYVFLWGQLYLALSSVENSVLGNDKDSKKALGAVINQELIIQFGLFASFPAILESSIEIGFLEAIWEFLVMQLQLSIVFYTFSTGTRAHFFGRTILHGGAKYRQTGRNFVVQHTSFAENYRLYARSHFIKAIEFGLILIVYAIYTPSAKITFFYMDMAFTCWLLVLSWIFAPFLFNPSGFDWLKTVNDFDDFMNWIWYRGSVFTKEEQSWESWCYPKLELGDGRSDSGWQPIFYTVPCLSETELQLSTVFYTFSMGTRAHFFGRTILHGMGVQSIDEPGIISLCNTQVLQKIIDYTRSHFIKAIEFGLILTVYAMYSPSAKVSCSLMDIFSHPLQSFRYPGGIFAKAEQSWESWWYGEQHHLLTTRLWGKLPGRKSY